MDHSRTILSALILAGSLIIGSAIFAQSVDSRNISKLISAGQIETARLVLESGNPSQADRVFFEARVLKAQRRLPEAIKAFRQVLQIDPNYINARRELAHTLLLNGDYGSAQYHFDALLQVDQNNSMRDGYHRFLNVIDQNKPIGFNGYFSILPSSNINLGTTNTVFDTTLGRFVIDPSAKAKSGVGAQLGFSGYFRHRNSPTSSISLNWSLSNTKHDEELYNSTVGNIAFSYGQVTGQGRWFLSPFYRKTWRKDDSQNNAQGLNFGLTHRLNNQNQLNFNLSHEYRNYEVKDYQDGTFSSATLILNHQIRPSLSLSGGASFGRSSPERADLQYGSDKLILGMLKSWEGGLQTKLGFEYGQREYEGIYPLTTSARNDDFKKISIGVQHSRINIQGFTPQLACSHIINRSNVAFFDYSATECQATISKNF
tara:strand:+ start:413 stop:1699 length:1287 start_codon:yes stop_codon:yes gene_type:complete